MLTGNGLEEMIRQHFCQMLIMQRITRYRFNNLQTMGDNLLAGSGQAAGYRRPVAQRSISGQLGEFRGPSGVRATATAVATGMGRLQTRIYPDILCPSRSSTFSARPDRMQISNSIMGTMHRQARLLPCLTVCHLALHRPISSPDLH